MILEGIVTTVSPQEVLNIAPMGAVIGPTMDQLLLQPYRTSQTYRNLQARGEGVLHVTDDVLLLAQAALGAVRPPPACFDASLIRGFVLRDACRYYEFQVRSVNDSHDRTRIEAVVLHQARLRDFFGFNRAKHAVLEAAILATRTDFLPLEDIKAEFQKLEIIVNKTGSDSERRAFALLVDHLKEVQAVRAH